MKFTRAKIDEVCFVVYSLPSLMTKTAKLSDRESVIFRVLPKDLSNELNAICADFEYHLEKALRPAIPGKLYFIKYPLAKHKPIFDELVRRCNERLGEFADRVFRRIEELRRGVAEFCEKYGLSRELSEAMLTREHLRARFKVRCQLLPMKLGQSLALPILTPEDAKAIEEDVRRMVESSYRELLNRELAAFFKILGQQLKRLQSGKMVTAHSLAKMRRMYEEVSRALSIAGDERYMPAFEVMTWFLGEMKNRREERAKSITKRKRAKAMVWEALEVAKLAAKRAKAILPKLEELSLEAAEARPPKGRRDEGLKELIRGVEL